MRVVPELDDLVVAIERALDDATLDAASTSVNQPNLVESRGRGRVDVLIDDRRNVARRECVQIEFAKNRDADGHLR